MQAWVIEWLPLLAVAGLAGLFNLIVASEKFNRKFRSPFFTPWTSLGLWWWVLIQLSLPTACFWLLFGSSLKLPITADLITKAITVGLGFTPFVNADIDLGFAGLPLGDFYFALTQLAYRQIAANQRGKLANFKSDLQKELSQNTVQLEPGLDHLKNYFEGDPSLRIEEERDFLKRIEAVRTKTPQKEQIEAIVSLLLEVRSRDCFDALKRFGCRDLFLKDYFPKKVSPAIPKPY